MMRLLSLLLLLPALALGQGLNPSPPGGSSGKVLASFPFATAGCFASGTGGVSITRTTTATYIDGTGTLQTCAAGEYRVAPDGLLVEPARTNVVKLSNTISAAGTFDNTIWAPWPSYAVVSVTTGAAAPMGGTWHTITNETGSGSNVGQATQTVTTGSSTTFVASTWMKKPDGEDTTHAAIHVGCGAGTPSACTCLRSDGGSCTASTVAVNYCQALVANLSTTPIRLSAIVTCSGATTSSSVALVPGSYGVSVGITDFTGVQHEIGTYPTSLIPTTTAAVARNEDNISTTPPTLPNKWCVAMTATPAFGRTWIQTDGNSPFGIGNFQSPNSIRLSSRYFATYDSAGNPRYFDYSPPSSPYRLVACSSGASQSWSVNGTGVAVTPVGTGTGVFSTGPTPLRFGAAGNGAAPDFAGYIKNFKICKAKSYRECK